MSAFQPTNVTVVVALAVVLLALTAGGYWLVRGASRSWMPKVAWGVFLASVVGTERLCSTEPPGVRMLALIVIALTALKLVVVATERTRGMPPLSLRAWLGFSLAWLGMRPQLFGSCGGPRVDGASALLRRGALNGALGLVLIVLARIVWGATASRLWATVLVLSGLSLVLHFGLGTLLAGWWRTQGVDADAVFRAPLRSESLAEFWARRWNLGFSEMTATLIYRPLSSKLGRSGALMAGFLWSGLLHEMAISVPVRAGLGLPTLYFLLHGGLVGVERALGRTGRFRPGWFGRAWSIAWVVLPLPLLFHPPFLSGVVWPLAGMPVDQTW